MAWQQEVPWFASKRKDSLLHWRTDLAKDEDPKGSYRAVKGCSKLVLGPNLAQEGTGVQAGNAAPFAWCDKCVRQLLRAHPGTDLGCFSTGALINAVGFLIPQWEKPLVLTGPLLAGECPPCPAGVKVGPPGGSPLDGPIWPRLLWA